jgi:hypothetical protein
MPLYRATAPSIEAAAVLIEAHWEVRPYCVYACAGGSDAHWQLWHPRRIGRGDAPGYIYADGEVRMHPDAPVLVCR